MTNLPQGTKATHLGQSLFQDRPQIENPSQSPPHLHPQYEKEEESKSDPEGEEEEDDVASGSGFRDEGSKMGSQNGEKDKKGQFRDSIPIDITSSSSPAHPL